MSLETTIAVHCIIGATIMISIFIAYKKIRKVDKRLKEFVHEVTMDKLSKLDK